MIELIAPFVIHTVFLSSVLFICFRLVRHEQNKTDQVFAVLYMLAMICVITSHNLLPFDPKSSGLIPAFGEITAVWHQY